MSTEIDWQLEHAVETDACLSFAWDFCTNVKNWNDPPAEFVLEGPFETGAHGTTLVPGQDPRQWVIRDVRPEELYVLEIELGEATVSFEWRFAPASERRTRLTQRIGLSGAHAAAHIDAIRNGFGPNLAPGMERIAAIAAAQPRHK